jgi:hypothetical protein
MPEPTSKYKNWSVFTETREIWPFLTSDDSLALSGIRYGEHELFVVDDVNRVLDSNPLITGDIFDPEIEFKIDESCLSQKSGFKLDNINATVVLRDRSLKRFYVVESFSADKADGRRIKIPKEKVDLLSLRSGLEIALILSPKENSLGYAKGSRLAQKVFSVNVDKEENQGFPVATIDPDDESKWPQEYSKDTAWFIQWTSDRMKIYSQDEDVSNILTVIYNEKIANKLYSLGKVDKSIGLFWAEIAVEIYVEIANVILNPDIPEDPLKDGQGFYPRMARSLMTICEQNSFEAIRALSKSPHTFQSFLRSRLQLHFKFKSKADAIYKKSI